MKKTKNIWALKCACVQHRRTGMSVTVDERMDGQMDRQVARKHNCDNDYLCGALLSPGFSGQGETTHFSFLFFGCYTTCTFTWLIWPPNHCRSNCSHKTLSKSGHTAPMVTCTIHHVNTMRLFFLVHIKCQRGVFLTFVVWKAEQNWKVLQLHQSHPLLLAVSRTLKLK